MSDHISVSGSNNGDDRPDDDGGQAEVAANGEGALAPLEGEWRPAEPIPPARERIALEAERIGLAKAVANSLYVADVFAALQGGHIEYAELFMVELGRGANLFSQLRTTYTGTLAGDFIRWCRGNFPGLLANDLAQVLAVSGPRLAGEYRAHMKEVIQRAKRRGYGPRR